MAKLTQQAFVNISQQIQAVAHKQVKVIVTVQQQAIPSLFAEAPFPPLSSSAHQLAAPISWTFTSTAPDLLSPPEQPPTPWHRCYPSL
ncbi:hypothetical protein A4X09_0g6476, partial [Tilletia walkeri]